MSPDVVVVVGPNVFAVVFVSHDNVVVSLSLDFSVVVGVGTSVIPGLS